MTPPARPDPVAALAQVLADLFADDSYQDRPDEFMGEAGEQIKRLAERGYVLVNADMLAPVLKAWMEMRLGLGSLDDERGAAAAILAALKGPAR